MYDETGPDGKRRYTVAQIAAEFGITRPTTYRHFQCLTQERAGLHSAASTTPHGCPVTRSGPRCWTSLSAKTNQATRTDQVAVTGLPVAGPGDPS